MADAVEKEQTIDEFFASLETKPISDGSAPPSVGRDDTIDGFFAPLEKKNAGPLSERRRAAIETRPSDFAKAAWGKKQRELERRYRKVEPRVDGGDGIVGFDVEGQDLGVRSSEFIPGDDVKKEIAVNESVRKTAIKDLMKIAEPLPLSDRLMKGLALSKEGLAGSGSGELGYLEKEYPDSKVVAVRGNDGIGNFFVIKPDGTVLSAEDKGAFGDVFGDVADVAADVGEGVLASGVAALSSPLLVPGGAAAGSVAPGPGTTAGAVAGAAGALALGGTVASIVRQAAGEMAGIDDFGGLNAGERAKQVALGSALEVGSVLGLNTVGRGVKALTPMAVKARRIAKDTVMAGGVETTALKASDERIAAGIADGLTLGQVTGSSEAVRAESDVLATRAKIGLDTKWKQVKAIESELDRALEEVGSDVGSEKAARNAAALYKARDNQMMAAFKSAADEAYADVRRIAGDNLVLDMRSLSQGVGNLIEKVDEDEGRTYLANLLRAAEKGMTIDQFQRRASILGKKVANERGHAGLTPGETKLIYGLMGSDLKKAAKSGSVKSAYGDDVAKALVAANDAFRGGLMEIKRSRNDTFEKLVKAMIPKTGESAGSAAADGMTGGKRMIRTIMNAGADDAAKVLRAADSVSNDAAGDLRRAVVAEMFSKAAPKVASAPGAGGARLTVKGVANVFGDNKEWLRKVLDPAAFDMFETLGRRAALMSQGVVHKELEDRGGGLSISLILGGIARIAGRAAEVPGSPRARMARRLIGAPVGLWAEMSTLLNARGFALAATDMNVRNKLRRLMYPPVTASPKWLGRRVEDLRKAMARAAVAEDVREKADE